MGLPLVSNGLLVRLALDVDMANGWNEEDDDEADVITSELDAGSGADANGIEAGQAADIGEKGDRVCDRNNEEEEAFISTWLLLCIEAERETAVCNRDLGLVGFD